MLIKYHLSREVALCLKLNFFDLHPPGAIEIDSAVNEHLLLRTFHWMHLPEQHTRLVHGPCPHRFWLLTQGALLGMEIALFRMQS